jgi:hypothetical protein
MERDLTVYLDLDGAPVLVGRLWARERTGRETSSFTYDPAWIKRLGAFALAPSLTLTPGPHHASKGSLHESALSVRQVGRNVNSTGVGVVTLPALAV